MARLIDVDSAITKIQDEGLLGSRYSDSERVNDVCDMLDRCPTVDAVEVVHGWWIELPGMEPDYKCSECGRSYAWWEPSEAHYCPNCGAKMEGVSDG